jgi:CubicO group peptidase (beta-lactamase class C family)
MSGSAAPALIGGHAHSRFVGVRDLFEQNFSDNQEIGASLAISLAGEMVVDLWGGWADGTRTNAWSENTIVNLYSVTKTMTALTALLLADRGIIDFDAPVSLYWPEFAQGGKQDIQIRHIMSHSAGLSGWREAMLPVDLYDWEKATTLLARQEPFWMPGTAPGYHGLTQGYLMGEIIRRATGHTLSDVFKKEIASPLDADIHLGLDAQDDYRVAALIAPQSSPSIISEPNALVLNMLTNPPLSIHATGTRQWRGGEIYAAGGTGNGRSIAKVHALLANGGELNGVRLISEAGCRRALDLQMEGKDLLLSMPARYGMGFGLPGEWFHAPHNECLFWPGMGGALAVIDMRSRMSFGYAMNRMGEGVHVDERPRKLVDATWNVLEN